MTWTRLDDAVIDHPKILAVSPLAELLFYRGRVYTNRHHTQGFIPTDALPQLARRQTRPQSLKLAAELVAVHLWHERPGGWEVHDWQDYERPSRDSDALSEAGARGGRRSVEVRREKYGTAQPHTEAIPKPLALKPIEARATGRARDIAITPDVEPRLPDVLRTGDENHQAKKGDVDESAAVALAEASA